MPKLLMICGILIMLYASAAPFHNFPLISDLLPLAYEKPTGSGHFIKLVPVQASDKERNIRGLYTLSLGSILLLTGYYFHWRQTSELS